MRLACCWHNALGRSLRLLGTPFLKLAGAADASLGKRMVVLPTQSFPVFWPPSAHAALEMEHRPRVERLSPPPKRHPAIGLTAQPKHGKPCPETSAPRLPAKANQP